MNILFVISSLGIGGEQRVASILTDNFINKGHNVDILVLNKKEEKSFIFNKQIKIEYADCDKYKNKNFKKIQAIYQKIKRGNYNAVIGFAVIPAILCSLCAPFTKVPVFVCERNDPAVYPTRFKMLRYLAYRFAKGGIFQTNEASEYFSFLKKLNKIVIPNPLDLTNLPPIYSGVKVKRIVNTARLVDAKNQEVIIEAFSRISNRFPEYKVAIYGDGPNKRTLEKLIKKRNMEHKIEIFDAQPNILETIQKDAIFVLSSKNEGFPNSLAEALAMGIPSISTNCRIGGPKDMIDNGVNGFLFNVGDIDGLENSLIKLMSDVELQNQFSNGAQQIREKLSAEKISTKWIDFIKATI